MRSDETPDNLPKLAAPARRALTNAGYTTLEQLSQVSEDEIKQLHGIGANALKQLHQAMAEKGLTFAGGILTTEPKVEKLAEQVYMGIRAIVSLRNLPVVIPELLTEIEEWAQEKDVKLLDPPFIRYHVIDMDAKSQIEVGWRVHEAVEGSEHIKAGTIPAGRYAILIYTDSNRGIEGNSVLIEWGKNEGLEWDAWDAPNGHAFRSRLEYFLDGPDDDPDPANWRTQVAIMVKD